MQVVCATCQLSFDAPEGATGLVCPICRGPLRPQSADGTAAAPKAAHEWSGGDLDDLIAILSAPAVSARVEVLAPKGEGNADEVLGEVHLLAGGVSESIFKGKSTDDALDRLRALNPTRFRVEQRLPNPVDGSLTNPGPETGTLDGRALAHLMRYCEDYVISCSIEVWRGSETARVEYKRGEISGVTVGGIDAPERLAEVMQWSSGNYRLIVPPFQLPATAPPRTKPEKAAAAAVPAPAASAQAARASAAASPTKTIFGMPVAEIAKARFPTETAKAAATPAPAAAAPAAPAPAAPATPQSAAGSGGVSAGRPSPTPAGGLSPTRTIYGVPAPQIPEGFAATPAAPEPAAPAPAPAETAKSEPVRADKTDKTDKGDKTDKKTGARKTVVPPPAMAPPPASAAGTAAPASEPIEPTTRPGYETRAEARKRPEPAAAKPEPARAEVKPEVESAPPPKRGTSIAAYVRVGFAFGLALLGIYELYAMLSH